MFALIQAVERIFEDGFTLSLGKLDWDLDNANEVKEVVKHPDKNPLPKNSRSLYHQVNETSNRKVPYNYLNEEEYGEHSDVEIRVD